MTNRDHERALDLITLRGVEDIAATDSEWLESHLASCTECSDYAGDFDQTGHLLRATAVTASSSLVLKTQMRVRARAISMREQHSRMVLIAISFCIGAMSSAASAWLWWRSGAWIAEHLGLPPVVVGPGIMVFLLLPAVAIAVVMLAFPHHVFDSSLAIALAGEREGERQ